MSRYGYSANSGPVRGLESPWDTRQLIPQAPIVEMVIAAANRPSGPEAR
jgi:hypothetical protein